MEPLDGYDRFKTDVPEEYEQGARRESMIDRTPRLAAIGRRLDTARERVAKLEARTTSPAADPASYRKRLARVLFMARLDVRRWDNELDSAIGDECEPPDPEVNDD